jgi:tetratricopeptide (TPR) repeat protein
MKRLIWLILPAILLAGCSKIVRRPPTDNMRQAADYVRTARQWESKQDWRMALQLYTLAWNQYVLSNRSTGKFAMAVSIARQNRRLGDEEGYRQWLDTARGMSDSKHPAWEASVLLLQVETAVSYGNYEQTISLTEHLPAKPEPLIAELLSYRVQADVRLGRDPDDDLSRLSSLMGNLERSLRKGKLDDPSILSYAYYAIGYAYLDQNRPEKALESFQKAYRIDQDYEQFASLADDLLMMGRCDHKLQKPDSAQRMLRDAGLIYRQLKLDAKADEIDRLLGEWTQSER